MVGSTEDRLLLAEHVGEEGEGSVVKHRFLQLKFDELLWELVRGISRVMELDTISWDGRCGFGLNEGDWVELDMEDMEDNTFGMGFTSGLFKYELHSKSVILVVEHKAEGLKYG